jgi:hypothetical protein
VLFANSIGSTCGPSGLGLLPGNDLIVALGCNFAGTTGNTDQQAGTMMHELGHNLGLDHGGPHKLIAGGTTTLVSSTDYTMNCKPNYLSVMSYTRQMPGYLATSTWESNALDYSHTALAPISPGTSTTPTLSEPTGLASSIANTLIYGTPDKTTKSKIAATGSNVDWNGDGTIESNSVFEDIKNFGITGCNTAGSGYTTKSFDDWDNLIYNFRSTASSGLDGTYPPPSLLPEITPTIFKVQQAQANQFAGVLPPLSNTGTQCSPSNACNVGSTIPVKFQLKDVNGNFVTTAQVTFTAQQINPTTGAPIGNLIVGPIPSFTYSAKTNQYQYNWKTSGLNKGTYVIDLFVDYKKSTQSLLVGPGQNNITTKVQLS